MTQTPAKRITKKVAAGPTKAVAKRAAPPATNGDDEAPRPVKSAVKKAAAPARPQPEATDEAAELRGGWSAAQETMDSTSTWAASFKPTTSVQIVKILEPAPYASYRRHWINRVGVGQRAYTCLESLGRPCPLCDVADRASAVSSFNIALCGDDGEPVLKSWDCGVRITQTLKTYDADRKIGPLNRPGLYFAVSKSEAAQRQQVQTLVVPARERDLQEDYGVPPLTEEKLQRLMARLYTPEIVDVPKASFLEEIAAEMLNEDTGAGSGGGWGGNS